VSLCLDGSFSFVPVPGDTGEISPVTAEGINQPKGINQAITTFALSSNQPKGINQHDVT
jgi:hypothetical protein